MPCACSGWLSVKRYWDSPLPDKESWEVCCFLEAKIQDTAKGIWQPGKSTGYYSLLLLHRDMNGTGRQKLVRMKENYKALRMQAKNTHAQVAFSSTLPARRRKEARSGYIVHINFWLHSWCQHESFDFYTNGIFYEDYNLLWRGWDPPV